MADDKKEFVTVGEGESQHAIPVDYMEKDTDLSKWENKDWSELFKQYGVKTDDSYKDTHWYKAAEETFEYAKEHGLSKSDFSKLYLQKSISGKDVNKQPFIDEMARLVYDDKVNVTGTLARSMKKYKNKEKMSFNEWKDYFYSYARTASNGLEELEKSGCYAEPDLLSPDIRSINATRYQDVLLDNDILQNKKGFVNTMKAENRIDLNIDNKGKGRRFESRFLQAGLVKYSFGVCLLSKEVIDRFAYKFVGCPVIIDHKDITDANAKDERVGVISKVWYNEFDGWFWCEGVVFDDEAISLIKDKGYNVSCQYNIDDYTENTTNALHNGNPYDITILDGTPEHLAIVKNPRYEEALIAVNKGEDMKAENTEFRTGYDSEGEAYVYPLEGADKSEKKDKQEKHIQLDKKEWEYIATLPKEKQDAVKKALEDKKRAELYAEEKRQQELQKQYEEKQKQKREKDNELVKDYEKQKSKRQDDAKNLSFEEYFAKHYPQYKLSKRSPVYELAKGEWEEQQAAKSEDKKEDKKYPNRHAEILYKDLPELREDLHKARYERAKKREQGADVTFYDKKIKELEDKEENLKEEMASIRDSRRKDGDRYKSLIEESKENKKQPKQLKLFNALEEQLERFVSLVAKNFDESKHDRDKDGKFTDSGNFSGESVDEQEAKLVKELKRLEKNGQDVSEIYKKLTGKEWGKKEDKKESKKENKPGKKSQKSDSVKFDKIGKVLTSVLKDAEKTYKESK